jgi:hypothetical protein
MLGHSKFSGKNRNLGHKILNKIVYGDKNATRKSNDIEIIRGDIDLLPFKKAIR